MPDSKRKTALPESNRSGIDLAHVEFAVRTELVNYISYFRPVFSQEEINEISAYLERLYADSL